MHLRDEGEHIDEALREALAVCRALDAPLVLSHHRLMGRAQLGRPVQTLALIEHASRSQAVCMDCYPYTASSTMLLPERVAASTDVQVTWSQREPNAAGRSLRKMAAERGMDPAAMAAALMPAGAIYFAMSDDDVDRILAHPLTMICSDGLPTPGAQHPHLWGSFPRVLGHYARDRGLMSLQTTVHKMTGLTAQRFGLAGRSVLRPGACADVTVFDAERIIDRATYALPTAEPLGVRWVLVNGQMAVAGGEMQSVHAGSVLERRR